MSRKSVSLSDKFNLEKTRLLLTGSEAVVRLSLMQQARDRRAGLDTAGLVTGYRGSPIAGVETQFNRAKSFTEKANIEFRPGINEDLAATALWGSQQAELRGEGRYDGVFGIWYGKGPGVDRTGDVFRHANHAGSSKHGGVLALMGDDHTCESSTSAHQSEFAFVDAMIPVLNPAGVQEILDFGLLGFALSRFAGVWVGLKCVKDNIEATATVDGSLDRVTIAEPKDFELPPDGLNIRLGDAPLAKEARLHEFKRDAILAFARANRLDRIVFDGGAAPKVGIVTTGKSYLDVREALNVLGLDEARAADLGLRLYKAGLVWPLEPEGLAAFADGLDLIIVVEEKRSLIETQIKEQLYETPNAPHVIGKKRGDDHSLFPAHGALEPTHVAAVIGRRLLRFVEDDRLAARLATVERVLENRNGHDDLIERIPYFCAGCPHNTSTKVPEGSRAYAGIGCHYMVQWMDRSTEGFTHMGGEGANWIGEAPFSRRGHVFQNLGDGTYDHSGYLAVRAAIASGVNMTYKLLYNDAVAMTGGQALDTGHSVPDMARQLKAEGVVELAVVTDEPHKYSTADFPPGTKIHHREDLEAVQQEMAKVKGVSLIIYDQTCAAEKRRRRKRGTYPDPAIRAFINEAVCEGCGDCGVVSNCVAVIPKETEFGRKRAIDQSACNKDFSCVDGFCPSFVTVHGGSLRKPAPRVGPDDGLPAEIASLPEPVLPAIDRSYSILVNGIGGTGVVTVSALLGMAAYIDEKAFGAIDMAGLAQKGGSVMAHLRIAEDDDQIHAIRAGIQSVDLVLGGDLIVTAGHKVLETVRNGHTGVVASSFEAVTGDFTHDPSLRIPGAELRGVIETAVGTENTIFIDAHDYAEKLFGDSIGANMFLLGVAWQAGLVPVSAAALEQAIEINGVAIAMNKQAFGYGRLALVDRVKLDGIAGIEQPSEAASVETLTEIVKRRVEYLTGYQDTEYSNRYKTRVEEIVELEEKVAPGQDQLVRAVAESWFRLLGYKDEYEVARLFTESGFEEKLRARFEGDFKVKFHLAPTILARRDPATGLPRKTRFGPWMMSVFRVLARLKFLRGTAFDMFGYMPERRIERQLIDEYERLLDDIAGNLTSDNYDLAVELAGVAQSIRGFGHVKLKSVEAARKRQAELREKFLAARHHPAPDRKQMQAA